MARSGRSAATAARHRARTALVQALYQWQVAGGDPDEILVQFTESDALSAAYGANQRILHHEHGTLDDSTIESESDREDSQ